MPQDEDVDLVIKPRIRPQHWFADIKKQVVRDHERVCIDARNHVANHLVLPLVFAFFKQHFRIDKYKTSVKKEKPNIIIILVKNATIASHIRQRLIAQSFGNRLASEPANKMYPEMFCLTVQHALKRYTNIQVRVWNELELKRRKFGLVLSVGSSSVVHPPRFLIIKMGPKRNVNAAAKTIVVVGKGVVFDSGGYNLKTSAGMVGMNGDKTGGALAVALAKYYAKATTNQKRIILLVPLVENLIGTTAQKVGDVHTAYNGLTVEVLNTDAEGRLIMADALAFACDTYKPNLLLDFATLTGWSQNLHCDTSYVFYTENEQLAQKVTEAGDKVGERSIRLPAWPEYMEHIKSDIADLKNSSFKTCEKGGGFMATMFLAHFVKNRNIWVHFDLTHVLNKHNMSTCNGLQTAIELINDF